MKLVTINTHSLIEENYEKKLEQFVDFVCQETPDIIAMPQPLECNAELHLPRLRLSLYPQYNGDSDHRA